MTSRGIQPSPCVAHGAGPAPPGGGAPMPLVKGNGAAFRFHADDEVDFDVDLRELRGQDRLDVFCGFLREIGRRLGKPVLMDPEGDCGHPMLGSDVEADRVVLLADPQVR
ncbi:hypothetical protein SAMN04490356_0182 [Streptomyces melanosporofaciens]|uniref:Uncharacterized protein n=1 Tax=Streptomyces melanosporofaciens TaxID=67327 RepID=A0A1H4I959_STRMJ|nr:hypothetical protein SAMN04490356_0182 [Streptomyces melanosporofaciens]